MTAGVPESTGTRVSVVPHGVGPPFVPPGPSETRDDFLLAVGDLYIQKNLHALFEALVLLKDEFPDIRLKVAGDPVDMDYTARLTRMITTRGLDGHVELLGSLSAGELAGLYRRCRLFVFPSLVETFGQPLVEAMASAAPIVSANTTAMPEVAGDAALYFNPHDPATVALRIGEALRDADVRRRLSLNAVKRAQAFSWHETARRTGEVLKAAARPDDLTV